jgi:hypothetical protein
MSSKTELYDILGISQDATPEKIKTAYKRRALATHPDKNPGSEDEVRSFASRYLFRRKLNASFFSSRKSNMHMKYCVSENLDIHLIYTSLTVGLCSRSQEAKVL